MINLIPPHGQTALTHEYMLRVGSVYCFILAGVLAASTALMIPTYVLTSSQLKTVQSGTNEMESTSVAFEKAAEEVKRANAVMAQLRINSALPVYSEIVEEIVRIAPAGISFTTFRTANSDAAAEEAAPEILVQGHATNRNALATFKTALEDNALFETATVPISDLARDTNLPFVVTITLATPEPS